MSSKSTSYKEELINYVSNFKEQNRIMKPDYYTFSMLCIKSFYYSDDALNFSIPLCESLIVDDSNDGGIDAILYYENDEEKNDLIFCQSKYYLDTPFTKEIGISSLQKMLETYLKLKNNNFHGLNDKVTNQYCTTSSSLNEDSKTIIVFFIANDKITKVEEIKKYFENWKKTNNIYNIELELNFLEDIIGSLYKLYAEKNTVDVGKLTIDKTGNYLSYLDYENGDILESSICNISANSLKILYKSNHANILGKNLRNFVKMSAIDNEIKNTIKMSPQNFWYLNNGIVIICDKFEFSGTLLKLYGFSIVNGGQTTVNICNSDSSIENDFFIQCKVIILKGKDEIEKSDFSLTVARATNSQKPIKPADLKVNRKEQIDLAGKLKMLSIQYILKRGTQVEPYYKDFDMHLTIEQAGKLILCGILQMAGSAKNKTSELWKEENYYPIYVTNKNNAIWIKSLLKLYNRYDSFIEKSNYSNKNTSQMAKTGKYFILSTICFVKKIKDGSIDSIVLSSLTSDSAKFKSYIRSIKADSLLFPDNHEIFEEYEKVFNYIIEIWTDRFDNEYDLQADKGNQIIVSNFVKSDENYYKNIIKIYDKIKNHKEVYNLI